MPLKDPYLPTKIPTPTSNYLPKPQVPTVIPQMDSQPGDFQIPPPAKGILGMLSTWPDRIGLKADIRRAELRAQYISANNKIILNMAETEKAKVELAYTKRMWLATYETALKQQNLEQWRIDKLREVEEAEFDARIADAKKRKALAEEP